MLSPLLFALLTGSPGDLEGSFELPDGLEATLWAESPDLFNPTAIDVDSRGRIWVTEAVNYRKWDGRNPGRDHPGGDRVIVLEDTDGDGQADVSKVFVQDEDLVAPLGIAVLGDRVVVSCSPSIFVYTDTDGDDEADEREVFLTGFGGRDHDHGLHSVVAGPDGRWYLNAGNAGPHLVTDRAGWSLRSGAAYVGGGPEQVENKPGLVSDDGRVWTGGLILRVDPDGTGLAVLAHNFRNNYEVAVDAFGNLFQSDNDDDGNASCRTLYCLEGGNHGYFAPDGSRWWTADRRPGQETQVAHWHQDDPGVVPAGAINGGGGPTGVAVYEGELMARWFDGAVLNADAGAGIVYAHRAARDGAGFDLEAGFMIHAADDDGERTRWFRPSDVAVGLDGAAYVADWYDPGVGGHLAGDREAYGRILRIAPAGHRPVAVTIDVETTRGAIEALCSPAVNVRDLGWRALAERGSSALGALGTLASSPDARRRARALWLLARLDGGRARVERALEDPDPEVRLVAFRALRAVLADVSSYAAVLVEDPAPEVRAEVAIALRDTPLAECEELLVELARAYDGEDRTYLEAFGLACDGKEEALWPVLVAELGDVPSKWAVRFEGLAWRLHPVAAIDAFAARAADTGLSAPMRRRGIDALAFTLDRAAADAVVNLALAGPEDLRGYARWWVEHRATNDWRAFGILEQLPPAGIESAELAWSSGVVTAGTVDVEVDVAGARRLWLVVTDGANGNSCDWADWIQPRLTGPDGETPLTAASAIHAEAEWGGVHDDANAVGDPIAIDGTVYPRGIGTHAYSEIGFDLPADVEGFRATSGVDDSGTRQSGPTSVEFQVWVERPEDRSHLTALQALVREPAHDLAARRAAATELALDPEGGAFLIYLADAGALDDELVPSVTEAIYKNPDIAVRSLASAHFARPGAGELPPVAELAALDGDPANGMRIFLDTESAQCATCHTFAGRGGDIGPELSHIRQKYGKEALLDAILNPNAGISFGYETWMIVTEDERVYSGFLIAAGADVVVKDTRGVKHVIASEEIVQRRKQSISTMPEGAALGLEPQEIADLAAFLLDDPDASPVYGEPIDLFDGTSLDGWTCFLNQEGARLEDVWSIEDGVLVCKGNPIGYLRTEDEYESYVLELEWRFDPAKGAGNSGVLLRLVGADEVWPKSIEAQLHSGNAGDIWNIGEFPMLADAGRTNGRRTVKAQPSNEKELGGWNRYRITLDGSELTLEVNGAVQNEATWCDVVPGTIGLQSEGAEIHFRKIRLTPILNAR